MEMVCDYVSRADLTRSVTYIQLHRIYRYTKNMKWGFLQTLRQGQKSILQIKIYSQWFFHIPIHSQVKIVYMKTF